MKRLPSTFPGQPHDLFSYSGALVVFLWFTLHGSGGVEGLLDGLSLRLVGSAVWCCHFSRRIIECLWVHRYAGRRVPLGDAMGEYVYYWGFAIWNAVALSSKAGHSMDLVGALGVLMFVVGEFGNSWAHMKLRALRRPNTNDRGIPTGGLFNWVSCANYTYELLAWTGFCVLSRTLASALYLAGIAIVLGSWAHKRHKRYHKLFDGKEGRQAYPAKRRAFIPMLY